MARRGTRQSIRARRRRQKNRRRILWGAMALVAVIVLATLVWYALRPLAGESLAIMEPVHVEEGTDPGPYNSNPPASGPHYGQDFQAGFYHEEDLTDLPAHPEGYLVHNLEHGYVILWYDCELLQQQECEGLKSEIQAVMDRFNGHKLIAFPWDTEGVPVILTSWGQRQEMQSFNQQLASAFIRRNRNQAPEPNAP